MVRILYSRDSAEVVVHSADAFAPVAYLHFLRLHLENKASRLQMSSSFKAYMHTFYFYVALSQFGVNLHVVMWVYFQITMYIFN